MPAPLRRAATLSLDLAPKRDKAALAYERMVAEYGRPVMSRRRFIERTMHVQDKRTGLIVPWTFNWPQRAIEAIRLKNVRAGRPERYAILKARKWGISTLFLGYALEEAERTPNFLGAIIADNDDSAAALLEQGKRMRNRQPFKLATKYDNRNQLYYASPLDSCVDIETAQSSDPLRGRTMRFVHGTEPQLWKDAPRKRAAIENAVPDQPGTLIAYEGTGYGRTWWYDFWFAARDHQNSYTAIFLPWLMDPVFDYALKATSKEVIDIRESLDFQEEVLLKAGATIDQLLWRRKKIADTFAGDTKLFAQEFPSTPDEAFLADGKPVFNSDHLSRAEMATEDPEVRYEIFITGQDAAKPGVEFSLGVDTRGALSVWKKPEPGREYVIGSDSGHGLRQDNSAAYVIDNVTGDICASLVSNEVEPRPFGKMVAALGTYYNWAFVMPEIEGPGAATLDALKECTYPKILGREIYDQRSRVVGVKLGFSTNNVSRPRLFNQIREHLSQRPEAFVDMDLLREMWSMQRDISGKEQAAPGKRDDRVIAIGVALMARRLTKSDEEIDLVGSNPAGSYEARHWENYFSHLRELEEKQDDEEPYEE
jgi:hypothetical protein